MRNKILVKRHILEFKGQTDIEPCYLAVQLHNQFGVIVDKPQLVCRHMVDTIAEMVGKKIPASFYKNAQDCTYFTSDELLAEQIMSYLTIEYIYGAQSEQAQAFNRVELFKKVLPNYKEGKEVTLRQYNILTSIECNKRLFQIAEDYCSYTRGWSEDEYNEFLWLYLNGYYKDQHIACKDNAIQLFLEYKSAQFAKLLDKKDLVKLSVSLKGEKKQLLFTDYEKTLLKCAFKYVKNCPLSKKQAKFYNTIAKKLDIKYVTESNAQSPYKIAKHLLAQNKVVDAAKVLNENGALLERNLVWLLSRATPDECTTILNMLKVNNPIVLVQLLLGIVNSNYIEPRVFKFTKNKKVKKHTETDYEFKYRKSVLSLGTKQLIANTIQNKLKEAYQSKPSLGKIYIDEEFKKIALPLNTSATGSGLDVLPVGSRLPITSDYIRTFCYWKNVFDIDASAIMLKDLKITTNHEDIFYWGNYTLKYFGDSALCSGDARGANGSEYQDFRINELLANGYKYVVYTLNGFGGTLNEGEIYCGYQNKDDLNTKAWSEKNIAVKINVHGDSRGYVGFAIDLVNKEMIILNQMQQDNSQIVTPQTFDAIKHYLTPLYLNTFNMYQLLTYRGELVKNPEDADVVFSSKYMSDTQKVITPFEIEKLVTLLK